MPAKALSIDFLRSEAFHAMLRAFFFEAMLAGYASDATPGRMTKLPGSKAVEHQKGDFALLDVWTSGANGTSHGSTHIWYAGHPVWAMQYMGAYADQAIPTLKAALLDTYRVSDWQGGRGAEFFTWELDPRYSYMNVLEKNDFSGLSCGEEKVFRDEELVGWHRYQSLLLA